MDIRQSNEYANFMRSIGWLVKPMDHCNIFVHYFPLVGTFIKIQRPEKIPSVSEIETLRKSEKAFKIVIEPKADEDLSMLIHNGFKPTSPYAPSKTIQIDLTLPQDILFHTFTDAKQRSIRKAEKNGIIVKEGSIEEFIRLKAKGFLFLQKSFSNQIRKLYEAFTPNKVTILIAYKGSQILAGVFLLFHDNIAYYWMATATKEGKNLSAPSLLVWEALKLAKEKGCIVFDFEGVFDERFLKQTNSWKGFSKFKEGFGGSLVSFPIPIGKIFLTI
jgi:lipid II:glycine glycyltransferase (peptidoglycan interpeptide bridge formation enzyme)